MSAEATNWVWKHSQAAGSDRLVLLALADFCNEKAECYASYGTLVKKTRLGQKTVYRCLKSLQSAGEVEQIKQGEFGQSGHLASEWRLPKIQACQTDQHVKLTPLREDKHVKLTPLACQIDLSTIHNNTDNNNSSPTARPQTPQLTVIKQSNSLPSLDSEIKMVRKREDVLGKGLTDEQWLRWLGEKNPQHRHPRPLRPLPCVVQGEGQGGQPPAVYGLCPQRPKGRSHGPYHPPLCTLRSVGL
jgi:hypothetical protein